MLPRYAGGFICCLPPVQVSGRIEELLHTAFENYFMLSEETASGMMDGALAVRSGIPAVLRPAVHLFSESFARVADRGGLAGSNTAAVHRDKMQPHVRCATNAHQLSLHPHRVPFPSSLPASLPCRSGA